MDGRSTRLAIVSVFFITGLMAFGGGWSARGDAMGKASLETSGMGPLVSAPGPALAGGPSTMLPTVREVAGKDPPAKSEIVAKEPATSQPVAGETVGATSRPAVETAAGSIEHTAIRAAAKADEGTLAKDSKLPERSSGMMGGLYSTLQVGGALAIVVGLIFIGRAAMRKFVPGASVSGGKGVIETLARYPIGRSQSVVLLRIGSQIVALNQTKDQSQSILVISEPLEVAKIIGQIEGQDPTSIQASFNRVLSNARMDLEEPDAMDVMDANKSITTSDDDLDTQLEEMAAAKRQLMELRAQVRSVRDSMPA